jgi:hypothetical protein
LRPSGSYLTKDYGLARLDTYSGTDQDSLVRRGIEASDEAGCLRLFDLSRTKQFGVRNMLYDDAGGQLEPPMGVVPFDGKGVFPQRGRAEALLSDGGFPIRGYGKFLLSAEKRVCCSIRVGPSFGVYQGHHKLSESPATSGRMPTCTAWLQGNRSSC